MQLSENRSPCYQRSSTSFYAPMAYERRASEGPHVRASKCIGRTLGGPARSVSMSPGSRQSLGDTANLPDLLNQLLVVSPIPVSGKRTRILIFNNHIAVDGVRPPPRDRNVVVNVQREPG